jgi:hypothetical protein
MVHGSAIAMLAAAVVLASCGGVTPSGPTTAPTSSAPPSPTATPPPFIPAPTAGSLGEALRLAGPIPRTISFTDWAAIRTSNGAEDLTGQSSFEEKTRVLRNEATFGFGMRDLRTQAADWAFDVFDLDWDVVVILPFRVTFLRFREGFDLASVAAKLESYGFTREELPHGELWTGLKGFPTVGGRIMSNADMKYSGFLDDGRTMVVSAGGADDVRAILTDGPSPVADLSVASVARLLGAPLAAVIQAAPDCAGLVAQSYARVPPEVRTQVDDLLAAAGPLHVPNARAVGYWRTSRPMGRFVLGYADGADAMADLAGRRSLATDGISAISSRSVVRYRDLFFVVTDARVEERAIVIDVGQVELATPSVPSGPLMPSESLPRFLVLLTIDHDMLFAAC